MASGPLILGWDATEGRALGAKEPKIDDLRPKIDYYYFEAFLGALGALQRTYVTEDSALAFYPITR